jgi:hypothetical protein
MSRPLVAGVMGGVGTTIIASALGAYDDDLYAGGAVDVLVAESTVPSLIEAQRAAGQAPYRPILVVVADVPDKSRLPAFSTPVKAQARMLEAHVAAWVAVPFVPQWRLRNDPYTDAATVLRHGAVVPAWLDEFATAMRQLLNHVETLLRSPDRQILTAV